MLIRSWFDESVKLLDVSPGSFNAFADDFVPSGSGGLGTPDALAWGADRNLSVSSNDSSQVLRYHGRSGAFVGVCDIDSDGNCDADDFFDYLDLFAGGCG